MLRTDYGSKAECDNHTERDFCSHVALDTFNEICIYETLRHNFFSLRERITFAPVLKDSVLFAMNAKVFRFAPLC